MVCTFGKCVIVILLGVADMLLKELGPHGLALVPVTLLLVVILFALIITIIALKYKLNKVCISIEGYGIR